MENEEGLHELELLNWELCISYLDDAIAALAECLADLDKTAKMIEGLKEPEE